MKTVTNPHCIHMAIDGIPIAFRRVIGSGHNAFGVPWMMAFSGE
ncbi:hypothetical protein SGP16001_20470 [Shigella flexneri]|nr:hypothetical protein SGP12048_26420 [Shigella flexneri]GLG22284.1 hypothetical protein SGP14013_26710 [Shigella flexneri]GLG26754.1 hypothetical protein SGP14014_26000 [Shigella flexneri]GLG32485.1 hypothetical protein SGP14015_38180 [Shigella flexneri]GLG43376.1 hypothetical protein SGP15020_16130 [Shigella flexneri]